MAVYGFKTLNDKGVLKVSDDPLGKGGEGSVYTIESFKDNKNPFKFDVVAKIYHNPSEGNRENKIIAMLKNVPTSDALAWPLAILYNNQSKFVGYIMRKLDFSSYRMWAELSHSQQRRNTTQDFDFYYALTAANNLALAIQSVHDAGHCLGDINESNIFIKNDASVFIVDTDSAQISLGNKIYPCTVGKPEYTAPEIIGKSFKDTQRTVSTDTYAYMIAVYQILTGGAHPTDGIFQGKGEMPSIADRIKNGVYPNLGLGGNGFKKVERVPTECLPKKIIELFKKGLQTEADNRISLKESINICDVTLTELEQCKKIKQHWFDKNDFRKCPWCARVKSGHTDIWGKIEQPSNKQKSLPNVTFNTGNSSSNSSTPQRSQRVPHSQTKTTTASSGWNNNSNVNNNSNNVSNKTSPNTSTSTGFVKRFNPENVSNKSRGKTIVSYADGSLAVRPPLLDVFKTQPKLAREMFFDEYPDILKFWWPTNRPLPVWWSLIIGLVISCGVAFSWFYTVPLIGTFLPVFPYKDIILHYWMLASMVSTMLFVTILLIVALKEILRMKKLYSNLKRVETEKWWRSVVRFIPISIFYGAIVTLLATFIIIFYIVKGIISSIQNESSQQVYYRY